MSASFRFVALPAELFARMHSMSDSELRAIGAVRTVADEELSFPCRVSLEDAEAGETVLSLPFVHHDVDTPYRASGPIYVRPRAETARPAVGAIPAMFAHRLLSVRAYDSPGYMVNATVIQGEEIRATIQRMFCDPSVEYIHVHNASPGCFNCRVERA